MGKAVGDDESVYELPISAVQERIVAAFRAVPGDPQALYILGSDWRVIDIMEELEDVLGVPVLQPVVVRCWYILNTLGRTDPIPGHGRLLAEMPPLP
jgi:maleate cis-trans isomerase